MTIKIFNVYHYGKGDALIIELPCTNIIIIDAIGHIMETYIKLFLFSYRP